jgi:hypothetical protein
MRRNLTIAVVALMVGLLLAGTFTRRGHAQSNPQTNAFVWNGLSGPLPPTPIFTPKTSAMYRVSAYVEVEHLSKAKVTLIGKLQWTDTTVETWPLIFNNTTDEGINTGVAINGSFNGSSSTIIFATANNPIVVRTFITPGGSAQGLEYNLRVVIENIDNARADS